MRDFVQTYCFPYILDLLLTPRDVEPIVVTVDPTTDLDLENNSDLEIRIRFSKVRFSRIFYRMSAST